MDRAPGENCANSVIEPKQKEMNQRIKREYARVHTRLELALSVVVLDRNVPVPGRIAAARNIGIKPCAR